MFKTEGYLDQNGLKAIKHSMDVQSLMCRQRGLKRQAEKLVLDYLKLGLPTQEVLSYVRDVLTDAELYLQKRLSAEVKAQESSKNELLLIFRK